jgi:hypothetical protein
MSYPLISIFLDLDFITLDALRIRFSVFILVITPPRPSGNPPNQGNGRIASLSSAYNHNKEERTLPHQPLICASYLSEALKPLAK